MLLLCIERELECWLMADIGLCKPSLPGTNIRIRVGRLPDFRRPDHQIRRPKTELIRLFQRELGRTRKYVDRDHALVLARAIPDFEQASPVGLIPAIRREGGARKVAMKLPSAP